MKLVIVSDIHGNWAALQAVLAAESKVDGFICLGDLVNYGPRPAECVRWAMSNSLPVWIVQGNHDKAVGCGEDPRTAEPFTRLAAAMLPYTAAQLSAAEKSYLAALPAGETKALGNSTCYLCHGVPSDPLYGLLELKDPRATWEAEIEKAGKPDFFMLGHTHRPFMRLMGKTLIVNPGSVGQPRDRNPFASYAVWTNGSITVRRIAYDVAAVTRDLEACAEPEIAQALSGVLQRGAYVPAGESAGRPI